LWCGELEKNDPEDFLITNEIKIKNFLTISLYLILFFLKNLLTLQKNRLSSQTKIINFFDPFLTQSGGLKISYQSIFFTALWTGGSEKIEAPKNLEFST
jgi:hypothetical protein